MKQKYGALQIISNIYIVIGYTLIALSILLAVLNIISASNSRFAYNTGSVAITAFAGVFAAVIVSLGLIGIGQLIRLFLDLEQNSRISAEAAERTAESIEELNRLMRKIVQRRATSSSTERE